MVSKKEKIKKESLENKVLYNLCNDYLNEMTGKKESSFERKKEILSAQIFLIGRSYSASPERRNTANKNIKFSGNGYDSFFGALSEEMLRNEKFDNLFSELSNLDGYGFGNKDDDIRILKKSIASVFTLNKIVKDSINTIDGITCEDEGRNQISFCSKFLHFYFPEIFFIYDSISCDKAKKFKINNKSIKYDKNYYNEIIKKIRENEKYKFALKQEKDVNALKKYTIHCLNEYEIAYKYASEYFDEFITRRVDYILMSGENKFCKKRTFIE